MQLAGAGQEAVEEVQLVLHEPRLAEPGDPQHFLDAKPKGLTVLKLEGDERADADAAVAVEVAALRLEEFAALAGVFAQGQQIVRRERGHGRLYLRLPAATGALAGCEVAAGRAGSPAGGSFSTKRNVTRPAANAPRIGPAR